MELEDQIIKVKKPNQDLLKNLEKAYTLIATNFNYVLVQSPLFLCFKKTDHQIGIELQFGGEKAILESLNKLVKSGSNLCFLIISSKIPGPSLNQIKNMLLTKFSIGTQKYIILDIETGRAIKIFQESEKFFSEINRPDWAKAPPLPPPPLFKKIKKSNKLK